jgi:hypothetical protein
VAEFVESLFGSRRRTELDYLEVRQALMQAANVSTRRAQGLLNHSRVVRTHKQDRTGRRIAVLQSEAVSRAAASRAGRNRGKPTIRESAVSRARELIEASGNGELLLSRLVDLLARELGCARHSLYRYLAEDEGLECAPIPNSRLKLCRVRNLHLARLASRVSAISSTDRRSKVQRAMTLLTEETVDVGLFLLSKEFEAALKDYLMDRVAAGDSVRVPSPDPAKWKLNDMISALVHRGVVTDQVTLGYLRQERNRRAHGSMPSQEERRALMRGVVDLGGLYIDYIKLIDDLT